jgi:hypothetical protein
VRVSLMVVCLSLACATAHPCLYSAAPPQVDDPFEFGRVFIEALAFGDYGLSHHNVHSSSSSADHLKYVTEVLYNAKAAAGDFACSATMMEVFARSSDEFIRPVAQVASKAFSVLARQQLEAAQTVAAPPGTETEVADRLSTIQVETDSAWEGLLNAAVSAKAAFVKFPANPEEPSHTLRLTAEQRSLLRHQLRERFGGDVLHRPKGTDPTYPRAIAFILYEYLSDSRWSSSEK